MLETGLGGRLDAVTACEPVATAITSIGLDHTGYLGDTLRRDRRREGGHRQAGGAVLARAPARRGRSGRSPGARRWSARRCGASGATASRPRRRSRSPARTSATTPRSRLRLARHAAAALGRTIDDATVARTLAAVTWPGRLEWIDEGLLLDAAHNAEGARGARPRAGGAGPRTPRRLADLDRERQGSRDDARGAGAGRPHPRRHALREPPRARPRGARRRSPRATSRRSRTTIRSPRSRRRAGAQAKVAWWSPAARSS